SAWTAFEQQPWEGPLRLTVKGRSMWPTLHPGDEVLVEPAAPSQLRRGDWAVIKTGSGPVIHRFLGFTPGGDLRTKGDAHRAPDPPWPPSLLVGRAAAIVRKGKPVPVNTRSLRERMKTMLHQFISGAWSVVRRFKVTSVNLHSLLLLGLALSLIVTTVVWAAVTLVFFEAIPGETEIYVQWETASEVDMSVFYVLRSLNENSGFARVSTFIPAEGDIGGAAYEFIDEDVEAGTTYYYKLEAVETNGSSEFHGPVSVRIPLPGEGTPTPTLTPTPTATPTATPTTAPGTPTATPTPQVRFEANRTEFPAGECATLQWETSNIEAVYLDGQGVPGVSGQTFCPCSPETHVLRVVYRNGTSEDFTITLTTQGSCTPAPPNSSPTPTFAPVPPITSTPVPPTPTATATPRAEEQQPTEAATLITDRTPTSTPEVAVASPEEGGTTEEAPLPTLTPTRPAVELAGESGRSTNGGWIWGVLGAGGALILLGGLGIWWTRRQR
ncbi:MAG: hypothetical protein JXB35_08110, partial [Anaerolineae bacterium]|nr:hypothetical protein [Anaerolineae bacterium]